MIVFICMSLILTRKLSQRFSETYDLWPCKLKIWIVHVSLEQASHLEFTSNDKEKICAYSDPLLSSVNKEPVSVSKILITVPCN